MHGLSPLGCSLLLRSVPVVNKPAEGIDLDVGFQRGSCRRDPLGSVPNDREQIGEFVRVEQNDLVGTGTGHQLDPKDDTGAGRCAEDAGTS